MLSTHKSSHVFLQPHAKPTVTWEDQQNINKFSNAFQRQGELQALLQNQKVQGTAYHRRFGCVNSKCLCGGQTMPWESTPLVTTVAAHALLPLLPQHAYVLPLPCPALSRPAEARG